MENTALIRQFAIPRPVKLPSEWFLGLDFGQRQDHSALAAIELKWDHISRCPMYFTQGYQPQLVIRGLRRFALDTPYTSLGPTVIDYIRGICGTQTPVDLVLDASGPGAPMVEMFRSSLSMNITVHPVIITSGQAENPVKGGRAIPRNALLTRLLLAMGAGSLIAQPGIPFWKEFIEEMTELSANDGHPRSGAHDDLVISSGLGLDHALRGVPELIPAIEDADDGEQKTAATQYGFKKKRLF